MSESIIVTDDGAVRVIRMNRPEKKNALTQPMYAAMTRAMREAEANVAIRCLVLAGGQGTFCAGATSAISRIGAERRLASAYAGISESPGQQPEAFGRRGRRAAVGIGTTLLFHCDHVVAAADATFATPFLKLALIPEAASSLLGADAHGLCARLRDAGHGPPAFGRTSRRKPASSIKWSMPARSMPSRCRRRARSRRFRPAPSRCRAGCCAAILTLWSRQIDTEVMHFKDRLQSDEARAAFSAFLSRKK